MVEPLRHRQTKGAVTDMFDLKPPRHTSILPRLRCPLHDPLCTLYADIARSPRDVSEVPLAAMTQVPQRSAKLIAVNRQPNSCDDQLSRNKAKVKRGTQGLIVLATRKPRVSKRTLILR